MMRVVRTAVLVAGILVPSACGQCLTTIAAVELRDQYTDITSPRTYNLCPNTVYQVGTFIAGDIPPFSGGDAFFKPRPNVQILCGDDGSSANNCTIIGGTVHVAASTLVGMTEPPTSVVFSGLTFADTNRYSFWGNMPGDITFNDCIFKDNTKAIAPVLLDYADETSTDELRVAFVECQFLNNVYFGEPANGALITGNGIQNRLTIQNSQFRDNDMVFNNTLPLRTSFLIESSGPLTLDLNCFYNNQVGVAAVGSYVADVDFSLNYGLNSSGSICEFLAAFETSVQFELYTPACVAWDDDRNADSCLDSQTKTPTIPPTGYPSATPSMEPTTLAPSSYPSLAPSSVPSISPYPTITAAPTRITEAPSAGPTFASGSSSMCVLMSALGTAVLSLWML